MKKLITLLAACALVTGMGLTAAATGTETDSGHPGEPAPDDSQFPITIVYADESGEHSQDFPRERLRFAVTPLPGNPDDTMIAVPELAVQSNPAQVMVAVPRYTKTGRYHYSVKEIPGNTQGVSYGNEELKLQVLAYRNDDSSRILTTVEFLAARNGKRVDTFTNRYDLGRLEVKKTVTGELGDRNKEFMVDVTLAALQGYAVRSDMYYRIGCDVHTVIPQTMEDGRETITVALRHGQSVCLEHIPHGITYTVAEHDYTIDGLNSDNGYDIPLYGLNDRKPVAAREGLMSRIAGRDIESGNNNSRVEIIGHKGAAAENGERQTTYPYGLLLAAVPVGAGVLLKKKHSAAIK